MSQWSALIRGLYNKVSDPLKVRHGLACIAEDIIWTHNHPVDTGRKLNVHKMFRRRPGRPLNVLRAFNLRPVSTGHIFMCNTKCQLQNAKSNFPKFCKVYARQKSKNNSDTFTYTFCRNHCFNSSFKSRFQKASFG